MNLSNKSLIAFVTLCVVILLIILYRSGKLPYFSTADFIPQIPNDYEEPDYGQEMIIEEDDDLYTAEDVETFSPVNSKSPYSTISLEGDVANYASNGIPLPNMSLYNVTTRSSLTGLGDPIRGDLDIKPRNVGIYQSQYGSTDLRTGALGIIG